eukprot:m.82586 g.82586  ORF g.82586 m.82586 type:complete len:338 (-) comp12695_c0_seq1:110-1123(-)
MINLVSIYFIRFALSRSHLVDTIMSSKQSGRGGKRKSKAYYGAKRPKLNALRPGLHGVLVTLASPRHEAAMTKSVYGLLNHLVDDMGLVPPIEAGRDVAKETGDTPGATGAATAAAACVEDELEAELAALKEGKGDKEQKSWLFEKCQTGCKGLVFINCTKQLDMNMLVNRIFSDIVEQKDATAIAHAQRLLPVKTTCRANTQAIVDACISSLDGSPLAKSAKGTTYIIMFKQRFNGSISKEDLVGTLAQRLQDEVPQHTPDLSNAEVVLLVEVVKNVACLSILTKFQTFHKYNVAVHLEAFADKEAETTAGDSRVGAAMAGTADTIGNDDNDSVEH